MFLNDEIHSIVSTVREGGLVLYPTDTVWGIGCNPFNSTAISKLFGIKQQNNKKSFILLVNNQEMLKKYVPNIEPKIQNILDYHTRPVTVIYEQVQHLPEYLFARDGSIAIRIIQDKFCQQLISELGIPLVSTTANIDTEPSPKVYSEVSPKIIQQMDYVVQYRQNDNTREKPSVIIKLTSKEELIFIRK